MMSSDALVVRLKDLKSTKARDTMRKIIAITQVTLDGAMQ
jgi:hypothetical protein